MKIVPELQRNEYIRELRRKQRLSSRTIASLAGCSASTVCRVLNPDVRQRHHQAERVRKGLLRDRWRELIRERKAVACLDCHVSYPYRVMHFDHVRGVKSFTIANSVQFYNRITEQDLVDEMDKCDVVCANCHALRHHG